MFIWVRFSSGFKTCLIEFDLALRMTTSRDISQYSIVTGKYVSYSAEIWVYVSAKNTLNVQGLFGRQERLSSKLDTMFGHGLVQCSAWLYFCFYLMLKRIIFEKSVLLIGDFGWFVLIWVFLLFMKMQQARNAFSSNRIDAMQCRYPFAHYLVNHLSKSLLKPTSERIYLRRKLFFYIYVFSWSKTQMCSSWKTRFNFRTIWWTFLTRMKFQKSCLRFLEHKITQRSFLSSNLLRIDSTSTFSWELTTSQISTRESVTMCFRTWVI